MKNLVRTTITLPADILNQARLTAVMQKTTLSGLIRKTLEKQIPPQPKGEIHIQLGKYRLGIKDHLSRESLYGDYLRRKIPT